MSEIPYDIWRHIATFLPAAILLTKLYSVNRAFLELAAETRYQAITFAAYETAKPLIKHVKESKLVRSVEVQPWIVRANEPKPCSSWSSSIWKLLNACVLPTYKFDEDVEAQGLKRLRKQIQRVTAAIKGLPNLNKYHIDWDEGPVHKEFFHALLHSVIPAVGRGLCSLSLKVPLPYMHTLPSLAQHLPYLEQLAITLHTGAYMALDISRNLEGLVVFINALLHKLRSFSLHTTPTSTYLDLGPLFDHLGHGRRLRSFTLCIPFDGRHLADPATLRRFLFKHRSTLESLALRTTRAAAHTTPGASEAKFWIRETLKNHPLPALSQLSLGLRPLRTELGPLLRYLTQIGPQLSVLRLLERPLEYTELAQILDVLASARLLRVLALRIRWLSPEVIDLLAAKLPALNTLELIFTEVVHQEPTNDASSTYSAESHGLSREGELTLFCQALERKIYSDWNLTRLAVPESHLSMRPHGQMRWLDAMERAFVGCIPGLTSFGELVSVA
ncbi:hypothetical protein C8R44DRAFT_879244 [Mycena epipterygia]|nr:hypothetical protein C8R44DRAFT_879244 [Mycena epipterygia]